MALNDRQTVFVEEYLKTFNATQAAIAAGYSPRTAYSVGWENLRKPEISSAISKRLSDTAMSADEVMRRLGEQARGNMGDFWNIPAEGEPVLKLAGEKAKDKLHLIKKLKVKTTTKTIIPTESEPIEIKTTEIDFELYDAQAALDKIGRHHKLFTDKIESTSTAFNVDMTLEQWKAKQKESQQQVEQVLDDFGDE